MQTNESHNHSTLSASQQERRAFVEKAGKLAAYTPPLMLGLLLPGEHAIASGAYDPRKKEKRPKHDRGRGRGHKHGHGRDHGRDHAPKNR